MTAAQSMSHSSTRVVINTRPTERAYPLSQALKAAHFEVVELPLLKLEPRSLTAHDHQLMQHWLNGKYEVTVVVSPTAAALGIDYWQAQAKPCEHDLSTQLPSQLSAQPQPHSSLVAVGSATAAVLSSHQITCQMPLTANNEGMIAMPLIDQLSVGSRVLMWRGLGGRRLLVETLRQRGVQVDSVAWYERVWPTDARLQYQQWLKNYLVLNSEAKMIPQEPSIWSQSPIVIISSGAAFEHWQHLLSSPRQGTDIRAVNDCMNESELTTESVAKNQAEIIVQPQLADFVYVVLGERLAKLLAQLQLDYVQVESLDVDEVMKAAGQLAR